MKKEYITLTALFIGQGLTGSIISLLTLTSTLAGNMLTPVSYFATLPVTTTVLGSALMVYYASHLMKKYGRRTAFIIGSVIGLLGSISAAIAIYYHLFSLFVFSTFILGGATVFNQYYRFAAAEVFPTENQKKISTSLIIGGGILGGILGPFLAIQGAYYFTQYIFLGTFFISGFVFIITLFTQCFIDISDAESAITNPSDSCDSKLHNYHAIYTSNDFIVGTLSCTLAFALMTLLMNSAPLAMYHAHFDLEESAVVLQWHFFAMYAPALVLPFIVKKVSNTNIILFGAFCFFVGSVAIFLVDALLAYMFSLAAVGIGWSFMFSGGTFLINKISLPAVKHKIQGLNSAITYLFNLLASLSVGVFMINEKGWFIVNMVSVLLIVIFIVYMSRNKFKI
ncbi:MAG: MFS transporter [Enterobacteriaceae bacterium]|jgi:MFS family permease|nr:MFS transporter [Enterobacteriaceae bacterium]